MQMKVRARQEAAATLQLMQRQAQINKQTMQQQTQIKQAQVRDTQRRAVLSELENLLDEAQA